MDYEGHYRLFQAIMLQTLRDALLLGVSKERQLARDYVIFSTDFYEVAQLANLNGDKIRWAVISVLRHRREKYLKRLLKK